MGVSHDLNRIDERREGRALAKEEAWEEKSRGGGSGD
jgi:hypothetical protein